MIPRLVPCLVGSTLVSSLVLFAAPKGATVGPVAPPAGPAGALPREPNVASRARPEDGALNHVVLAPRGLGDVEIRRFADDLVAHMAEAHPEVAFTVYEQFGETEARVELVHVLMESVNSTAQEVFLEAAGRDETCRALAERQKQGFEVVEDASLRLVASDPEKERREGRAGGLIVWELETHFPRVGQAVECVEALVRHLNEAYPVGIFRGYDEWFPHSGRVRIHAYGTGIAGWERVEARMRRDPVVRELFEGAADAFVPGGFEDTWMVRIAGG